MRNPRLPSEKKSLNLCRNADVSGLIGLGEGSPLRLIVEAEDLLVDGARAARFGRFQMEAAIQSVHAQRAITGRTNVLALMRLYDRLVEISPTVGARVARASTYPDGEGPAAALAILDQFPASVETYQPFWVVRAKALHSLGQEEKGRNALSKGIALTRDHAVQRFLTGP